MEISPIEVYRVIQDQSSGSAMIRHSRLTVLHNIMSMSPMRSVNTIYWKRDDLFFVLSKIVREGYTNPIAHNVKRIQVIHYQKNVEQHRSITGGSAHRAHLSYCRSFGSFGYLDVGWERVHSAE